MMNNKNLYIDLKELDRIRKLENSADDIIETEYFRVLLESELLEKKSEYVKDSIKLAKEKKRFDIIKEAHKDLASPIKTRIKENLSIIELEGETITGKLYLIKDFENGEINFYNDAGQFIKSKRMSSAERQSTIFSKSIKKAN